MTFCLKVSIKFSLNFIARKFCEIFWRHYQGSMHSVGLHNGEHHWTVHVRRRCGLLSNFFHHLLLITTQLEKLIGYSLYHPTEGRRLDWSRRCSKGVRPARQRLYRSGCHAKLWFANLSCCSQACHRQWHWTTVTLISKPLKNYSSHGWGITDQILFVTYHTRKTSKWTEKYD